jgi:hypothetical protein
VRNEKEFEHYRLMADIRVEHLRFLEIVEEANAQASTGIAFPMFSAGCRH